VFIMPTEYPAWREADGDASNRGVEAPWIEGALAETKRTQRELGLIGRMKIQPTTEEAGKELTVREAGLPPKLRDWRAKLTGISEWKSCSLFQNRRHAGAKKWRFPQHLLG